MKPIAIIQVLWIEDYKLLITFDDGKQQLVDFKPFLSSSNHPAIRAFLEPSRFKDFHVEFGDLVWGDYDLCFPIADLYENRIQHAPYSLAA